MKKVLALTLSLLILVSTIVVGFTGITAAAEENITTNLMDISLWEKSTARPYIKITEAVEDGYNTIKIYDSQYSYVYVTMELKPDTEYQMQFDFKSAYKFDCYEIWPTKCNCAPKINGGVGPGEGYTTDDRLVINYTYFGDKTDNINWYENNVINFKTNATDSSYQFFLTFGGIRDAATNATKSTFFKNFTVKEKVIASADVLGNGTANVSKSEGCYGDDVTYTATANNGEEFLGWYKDAF